MYNRYKPPPKKNASEALLESKIPNFYVGACPPTPQVTVSYHPYSVKHLSPPKLLLYIFHPLANTATSQWE